MQHHSAKECTDAVEAALLVERVFSASSVHLDALELHLAHNCAPQHSECVLRHLIAPPLAEPLAAGNPVP